MSNPKHTEGTLTKLGELKVKLSHSGLHDIIEKSTGAIVAEGLGGIEAYGLVHRYNLYPDLLAACREFIRFADLPESVPRGDYIRYQVLAYGAAQKAIANADGKKLETEMTIDYESEPSKEELNGSETK